MASKKKKKFYQQQKTTTQGQPQPAKEIRLTQHPLRFAAMITAAFFAVVLLGIMNHEMWRDEHQAWLVARDAGSLQQLLENMKYEGNPALWHFFLFWITRVTHDPVYMQAFHLLLATGFVFVFTRYSPLSNLHKILFSFGYFALYEYAVISRSYSLGILLIFIICALYKNRTEHYILIGVLLALLANVTIYAVVIGCGLAAILILDYFLYQEKSSKRLVALATGMIIFSTGLLFSLYQILPEKDNSFPAAYADGIFDFPRWWQAAAKLFTTYFYIPKIEENFWNTSLFAKESGLIVSGEFSKWLNENPAGFFTYIIMPVVIFIAGVSAFVKKPLILLLYLFTTTGLLAVYYYTSLMHSRYSGYLSVSLIVCYWLSHYYPEKKYYGGLTGLLSGIGNKIKSSFLTAVLGVNIIGAIVAFSMDLQYKFSTSKDAADFIKTNKLDTLPLVGITDFTVSPMATYFDRKIYYPQMNELGSFTIWNNRRINQMNFQESVASLGAFMDKQGNEKVLWIKDSAPQVSLDGKTTKDMERAVIRGNLQVDLLKKIEPGIVKDELYFIYLVQKVDPSRINYNQYMRID